MSELVTDILKTAGLLFLAFVGGVLGYIYRELQMGKKLEALRVLFAGLTAVFFAYLIKVASEIWGLDPSYAILIAGVASWFGADVAANFLMSMILKRFGIGHGYFKVDAVQSVSAAPGSCSYLRGDIYPSVAEIRKSETENGTGESGEGDKAS